MKVTIEENTEDSIILGIEGIGPAFGMIVTPTHYDPKKWCVQEVEIPVEHRRKGLGTKLYDEAQKLIEERGAEFIPSRNLSTEAFSLWRKRNPKALTTVLKYFEAQDCIDEYGVEIAEIARKQLISMNGAL